MSTPTTPRRSTRKSATSSPAAKLSTPSPTTRSRLLAAQSPPTTSKSRGRRSQPTTPSSASPAQASPKRKAAGDNPPAKKARKEAGMTTSVSEASGLGSKATLNPGVLRPIVNLVFDLVNQILPDTAKLDSKDMESISHQVFDECFGVRTYPFTEVSTVFGDFVHQPPSGTEYTIRTHSELLGTQTRPDSGKLELDDASKSFASFLSNDVTFNVEANDLQNSPHVRNVCRFISVKKEMSHRILIDPMLLQAVAISVGYLAKHEDMDQSLSLRHVPGEVQPATHVEGVGILSSWVTLQAEVHVPNQRIDGTNICLGGDLDYLAGWVPAFSIARSVNGGHLLRSVEERCKNNTLSLTEAKKKDTVGMEASRQQSIAQGVAELCRSSKDCIINVLTDGETWEFIKVCRTKNNEYTKPFHYSMTQEYKLSESPELRPLVLKLLVAAMIGNPEDFDILASVC
ncbi:hypothetical protein FB45DRAFT_284581 [Roridomyces roridus]|uniref:Uncharacterized protein n=1 Tax=Roridomyces roridus TaxID=1738132 RepID=A0AAD7CAL1_9AGAR|nr:hypothetical protein FB45DRAFT_284581 [Roridomyces roridus]